MESTYPKGSEQIGLLVFFSIFIIICLLVVIILQAKGIVKIEVDKYSGMNREVVKNVPVGIASYDYYQPDPSYGLQPGQYQHLSPTGVNANTVIYRGPSIPQSTSLIKGPTPQKTAEAHIKGVETINSKMSKGQISQSPVNMVTIPVGSPNAPIYTAPTPINSFGNVLTASTSPSKPPPSEMYSIGLKETPQTHVGSSSNPVGDLINSSKQGVSNVSISRATLGTNSTNAILE